MEDVNLGHKHGVVEADKVDPGIHLHLLEHKQPAVVLLKGRLLAHGDALVLS